MLEGLYEFLCRPHVQTTVIAISLLLLLIVTVLIVRRILSTPLQTKVVFNDIVSGSGNRVLVKASQIPDMRNALEFGYSFWLYLQPGGASDRDRLVMAHPIVGAANGVAFVLRGDSNGLKFVTGASTDAPPEIKYVPMSRWVHIVAVYANGTVTFFMDGEVHSVFPLTTTSTFAGPSGDLTVGGGAQASGNMYNGFQGYVGYTAFMNFYPSPGLVKRLYAQGPTPAQGLFSMFGMVGYGVRSPIYRISNAARTANDANVHL